MRAEVRADSRGVVAGLRAACGEGAQPEAGEHPDALPLPASGQRGEAAEGARAARFADCHDAHAQDVRERRPLQVGPGQQHARGRGLQREGVLHP